MKLKRKYFQHNFWARYHFQDTVLIYTSNFTNGNDESEHEFLSTNRLNYACEKFILEKFEKNFKISHFRL